MFNTLLGNKTSAPTNEIEPYAARDFVSWAATLKPNEIKTINNLLKNIKLDNMADFEVSSLCLNYKLECFNNRLRISPIL